MSVFHIKKIWIIPVLIKNELICIPYTRITLSRGFDHLKTTS